MRKIRDVKYIINNGKKNQTILCDFCGGGGVVVSMVSRIIPVLTVGMVPSSIIPTSGLCQTYSKELSEDDIDNCCSNLLIIYLTSRIFLIGTLP